MEFRWAKNRRHFDHRTIIQTGITCKKIPCYMRDSACRCSVVKRAKTFWSYVKHFWILTGVRNCRILIGLCKWVFLNCPTIFLVWHNKGKEVAASSFSWFLYFLLKKQGFLQGVTVLSVIISLYINKIHGFRDSVPVWKCTVATSLRKNFKQLFISSQAIQGDYSVSM